MAAELRVCFMHWLSGAHLGPVGLPEAHREWHALRSCVLCWSYILSNCVRRIDLECWRPALLLNHTEDVSEKEKGNDGNGNQKVSKRGTIAEK